MNWGKPFNTLSEIQPVLIKPIAMLLILILSLAAKSQSLVKVDSLEALLNEEIGLELKIDIHNQLAIEMMSINNHLVKQHIDSALFYSNSIDYQPGLAIAYHNKGRESWLNAYYTDAEKYYKQSLSILYTLKDSVRIAATYSYLGLSYYYHSENDSALKYHFNALSLNESLGNSNSKAFNLENIALSYQQIGQFDKAIDYSTQALQIRLNTPGYLGSANDYDYGRFVFNKIAFDDEVAYLKDILKEELQKSNNENNICRTLNNIGSLYQSNGKYDSAVHYLRWASEENKKIGIPYRYAGFINELAQSLHDYGQLNEAEAIFKECLSILDSIGHRTSRAIVRYNLAKVNEDLELLDKALLYADEANDIAQSMIQNPFLANILYLKSRIYLKTNNYESARNYAQSGLKMSHDIGVMKSVMQGYETLSKIYVLEENYPLALEHTIKHAEVKESVYSGENSIQIAKIQSEYENKQKNKEIELLNAQSLQQLSEIKVRNLVLFFTLLAIIFLAIVLYKRWRYTKRANLQLIKIEEQNLELAKRNSEKDMLMGEIHHRVKNNLQVISSILNLQSRNLADMGAKEAIQEGRNRVKAMALIHQHLYKHDEYATIGVSEYIVTLIGTIASSFGFEKDDYILKTNIENIKLDIDHAIKLGLITNELITNVFKHAFCAKKQNILDISLTKDVDTLNLCVLDNGSGVTLEFLENSDSFGIYLVKNLVDDMEGHLSLENKVGTKINLTLKLTA